MRGSSMSEGQREGQYVRKRKRKSGTLVSTNNLATGVSVCSPSRYLSLYIHEPASSNYALLDILSKYI